MLVTVEQVLDAGQVAAFRARLEREAWVDGRATAGEQSAQVKDNLQLPQDSPAARELGEIVLSALGRNPAFISAALPLRVFPPLFNRYAPGMGFGDHVDNAIRFAGPVRFRTDLSATLFLSEPSDYDGGELVVQDAYGEHAAKLSAGDMVLYPASSVHRVAPVTRGVRTAAFFWVQSMIRDDGQRTLLHELDETIQALSLRLGQGAAEAVRLTGVYNNLLRMWADT
jgi:PKHD-type hydroxylase